MIHTLKILPEYFKAVESGSKTFELRKFDRPFAVGDTVILQEFSCLKFSGLASSFLITYVLSAADVYGLLPDYCIFGISPL